MEGVEDVEPAKWQVLPGIAYGYVVPKSVIKAPVTVRKRSTPDHNFKRQLIFLKQFLVLRIVVRGCTVEDRIEFFGLLVRNTRILDYGECRPVAQSRILLEGRITLSPCRTRRQQCNQNHRRNPVEDFHSLILSLLSTAIALCLPCGSGPIWERNARPSTAALNEGAFDSHSFALRMVNGPAGACRSAYATSRAVVGTTPRLLWICKTTAPITRMAATAAIRAPTESERRDACTNLIVRVGSGPIGWNRLKY